MLFPNLRLARSALRNHVNSFLATSPTDGQSLRCQVLESSCHQAAKGTSSPKHPPHPQAFTERRPIAHFRDSHPDRAVWPAHILLQQYPHKSSSLLLNPPSQQRRLTRPTAFSWQENCTSEITERFMESILHGVFSKFAYGIGGI